MRSWRRWKAHDCLYNRCRAGGAGACGEVAGGYPERHIHGSQRGPGPDGVPPADKQLQSNPGTVRYFSGQYPGGRKRADYPQLSRQRRPGRRHLLRKADTPAPLWRRVSQQPQTGYRETGAGKDLRPVAAGPSRRCRVRASAEKHIALPFSEIFRCPDEIRTYRHL